MVTGLCSCWCQLPNVGRHQDMQQLPTHAQIELEHARCRAGQAYAQQPDRLTRVLSLCLAVWVCCCSGICWLASQWAS